MPSEWPSPTAVSASGHRRLNQLMRLSHRPWAMLQIAGEQNSHYHCYITQNPGRNPGVCVCWGVLLLVKDWLEMAFPEQLGRLV